MLTADVLPALSPSRSMIVKAVLWDNIVLNDSDFWSPDGRFQHLHAAINMTPLKSSHQRLKMNCCCFPRLGHCDITLEQLGYVFFSFIPFFVLQMDHVHKDTPLVN